MSPRRLGLSTLAIHGLPRRRPDWTAVAPSVVQSSTFTNPVGSEDEVLYARYGNTPTQVAAVDGLLRSADRRALRAIAALAMPFGGTTLGSEGYLLLVGAGLLACIALCLYLRRAWFGLAWAMRAARSTLSSASSRSMASSWRL